MPVASLLSMAIRGCTRNITGITDVADMPYDIIKPVLRKIQNPDQLHEIEENSPHIADSDSELWRAFIARDIPNWQEKILEPKNPRSWWKVYRKLVRDEKKAKEAQEEELRAAMSGLSQKREENKATFVERVVPMKSKERAFVDGVRNPHTNGWGESRTPALRNAKRAKDVMTALRSQSRQAARDRNANAGRGPAFSTARQAPSQVARPLTSAAKEARRVLPKPAEPLLPVRNGGFARQSSPSRVDTALAKAEAEVARLRALAQANKGTSSPPPSQPARPVTDSIAAREARLRALTQSQSRPTPPASSPPAEVLSRKRPASSLDSEANTSVAGSRLATPDSMAARPSPIPEMMRKRPPVSSPLMPAKRRKV
ncbi:hypothetical protein LTR15_003746 [Elasticomyces elasticus]|nr:hypothetical protein LTR15_003746 [Elasticomyces elasticus]